MNTFAANLYRNLTCAAAAALISLVAGLSFVQSTSTAPGAHTVPTAVLSPQSAQHA
jgi:hypothetical protein